MKKSKTLDQWLQWISHLHPQTIDMTLERVMRVAHRLQLTTFSCPVVTVAGTNGKGTVVNLLATILKTAGYRVGAYTSPHLLRFNERIVINGAEVSDDALLAAFAKVQKALQDSTLTYFEYVTLAALWLFQQASLDVVVLEVGMGGRLDAVNIVDPTIAVITSIDLDHQQWLGTSRDHIGFEKAGILRAGGRAVFGDAYMPKSLIKLARKMGVRFYQQGKNFSYRLAQKGWNFYSDVIALENLPLSTALLQNTATALMVCQCLGNKLPLTETQLREGLRQCRLPGRLQVQPGPVSHVFDVAHNPQATYMLAQMLQYYARGKRVHAVFSLLADKNVPACLAPLVNIVQFWYYGALTVPRAASLQQLQLALQVHRVNHHTQADSVEAAYQKACEQAETGDVIVVFGSFHTVAAVMQHQQYEKLAGDAHV